MLMMKVKGKKPKFQKSSVRSQVLCILWIHDLFIPIYDEFEVGRKTLATEVSTSPESLLGMFELRIEVTSVNE